jgi:hypothetical protein
MTPTPPNKALQDLTDAITELYVHLDDSAFNKFFKDAKNIAKDLKDLVGTEIIQEGKKGLDTLARAMEQMNGLQERALASNKNLTSVISRDLIESSFTMGTSIRALSEEVLQLNEAGISKLDKSTLLLVGRMKATGQNVEGLSRFLSVNNSILMLNQSQAQDMAAKLSTYSQKLGATQESILRLSETVSKNFELQAALASPGQGGNLPAAFAALGARLGGKADQQVALLSQIFGKGDLSQLIQLGISDGFQEALLAEKDPAKQQALMDQMIRTAAASVQSKIGGMGQSTADRQAASQMLKSMGGENVLVFKQLASMLGDARQPIQKLSDSLTTFNSLSEAFSAPMQLLGTGLLTMLNNPYFGWIAKGLAGLAGVVTPLIAAFGLFAASVTTFKTAAIASAWKMLIAAGKWLIGSNIALAASMPFQLLISPLAIIAAVLGGGYLIWSSMSEDIKELNNKTPDPRDKTNAGLTGQIFSQLVNIITNTNTNYMQREMLQTQKELVRLTREQNDRTSPNNSLVTPTPKRAIAGGI